MKVFTKSLLRVAMLMPLVMQGCATIGESEFKCKGYPDGLPCTSLNEVYTMTDGDDYQEKIDAATVTEDGDESTDKPKANEVPTQVVKTTPTVIPDHSRSVIPLRTPSQVMRVQIRPWESKSNVFVVPGYHYVEIEERRWMIGNRLVKANNRLVKIDQGNNIPRDIQTDSTK